MLHYRITRWGTIKKEEIKSYLALFRMEYLLLGRSRSGVRVGAGVDIFSPESEYDLLKIRGLRGPGLESR